MFGQVLTGLAGPWLVAGLVAATALLTWLHMRRPRRRRVLVSFEELWAGLPGAARSRGWSARIRQIAPLVLQLAVVWALLIAAADPRRAPRPQDGQALAILIDSSASMGALSGADTGGRRLDVARERVRALVEGLGVDDRAAIVSFAARPRPLTDLTGDRGRLGWALDQLRVEPEAGVVGPALAFARALVTGQPRSRVIVVSDQPALRPELGTAELLLVGAPADNVAIAGLTAQPGAAPGSFRVEVTVRRFGRAGPDQRVEPVELSLRAGERTLATLTAQVPSGGRRTLTATVPGFGAVSARLERPAPGPGNALALDDHASIPLPQPRPRRVLAVGARNLYLEGALLGLAPAVSVDRLDPGVPLPAADYDMIVFDGTTPAAPPVAGRYLFLDPTGPGSPFPARGTVRDPVATEMKRDHPLLAHVSLADLNVARARRLLPGPDDEVVAAALGTPLLIARQRPDLRVVALAFDPRQSDLPLRPAFPLLLANALDWLTSGGPVPSPPSTGLVDARESDTAVTGLRAAATAAAPSRVRPHRPVAPWLLALAGLLAVAEWGLFGRRLPRLAAARLGLLSGRGLFLAAVAAAIAAVVWTLPGRSVVPALAAVVDVSASVDDQALKQAAALLAALPPGDDRRGDTAGGQLPRSWRFAELPAPLAATREAPLMRLPGAAGWRSDPGLALAAGLAALDPGRPGRLLLLSDGVTTQGALEPIVDALVDRGVSVWVAPLAGRAAPEAAVTGLRAVGELRPGASFVLEAELRATRATEARLRLTRDGQPLERIPERTVALAPGTSSHRFVVPVPPERSVYRVQITGPAGIQPPSDSALLALAGARRPRVLILAEQRGSAAAFARALAAEQIETAVVAPGAAPAAPAAWLAEHELVVLADVPAARLAPGLARALRGFVHDQGGGLLVSGDPGGWGGGGYEKTALAPLLPLQHDPGERKQEATLALALVIDRSGSMSGPKMELTKQAARGAAQLLQPPDLIAVITFDSQAQTAVRLQPAANRQRVASGIAAIRSGGGTNVLPGLREGLDQLLNASARRKHVIVLSDGQSPAEGVIELVDEAASAHITVSAVGVGDAADLTLLQNIAHRGGGRFHHARDPATVPRIFTRETAELTASPAREAATRARLVKPSQALANIPFASAPSLGGHARAKLRPGAELLLATQNGEPLLARWHQGLGQVMVWTADLGGRWTAPWTRWREYPRLWGQLARSAMSRRGARELPLELRYEGDELIARVRASDLRGRPLTGLTGDLHLAAVAASGQLGPLQPVAPLAERAAGRYEARVPAGQAAGLLAEARLEDPEEQSGAAFQAQGQLSLPQAPDLTPPEGDAAAGTAMLATLARRTGGQVLSGASDQRKLASLRAPAPSPTPEQIPLRPPLALAALALFLADVASRRANFRAPGPATVQG